MRLSSILILFVILSMAVLAGSLLISEVNTTYDVPTDSSFSETYNKMDQMSELSGNIKDSAGSDFENVGLLDSGIFGGGVKAVQMVTQILPISKALLTNVAEEFGVPTWVVTGIAIIILLVVIFGIISSVVRRDL